MTFNLFVKEFKQNNETELSNKHQKQIMIIIYWQKYIPTK